jgi:uncharacterized membrane protein
MKKMTPFHVGILMLTIEVGLLIACTVVDQSFGAKILSMITANHIGGRLPFITVGLENGFSPFFIIPLVMFYNTTYVLLMYSLFVFLSSKIKQYKIIDKLVGSMRTEAEKRKRFFKRWSRLGISIFVWIPLPWTGAAIGSYIAHMEGYSVKDTLMTVLPAMWVGVICWTLWFDELYQFIERFGREKTMLVTVFLLVAPVLIYLLNLLLKRRKC